MGEILYEIRSIYIAGFLFLSMALLIEIGYRVGRKAKASEDEACRAQINAIQASLLGILALLLGFTFSLSLQRFDSRGVAVVDEANAIGTAYLRAHLLPAAIGDEVKPLLRHYVDLRVEAGAIKLTRTAERHGLLIEAGRVQNALWALAARAADEDGSPVRSGLFIQSLNEMIDSFGRHNAAINRHVPEVVLLLLYVTFLMAGAILGYSSGVSGHRVSVVTYIMVGLIVLLVFIILDLDRPRRGIIQVDRTSLTDLQALVHADAPMMGR